jgi:hypothetical protein
LASRPSADVLRIQAFIENEALFHPAIAFRTLLLGIGHLILPEEPCSVASVNDGCTEYSANGPEY